MNTQTNNELVAEIHEAFYSADERLLQEAKAILADPQADKSKRAERIKKLGFGAAKPVKEVAEYASKSAKARETISSVEYWRIRYPNNKFITEPEVKRICGKYGLVLGDADKYLGDIPEKNLSEIEAFELRTDDFTVKGSNAVFDQFEQMLSKYMGLPTFSFPANEQLGFISSRNRNSGGFMDYLKPKYMMGVDPFGQDMSKKTKTKETKVEKEKPPFEICAPQKDFNTAGYVLQEGYILVYDPVVLQPVKDGYLIVSAWGLEASDELVINHNQN